MRQCVSCKRIPLRPWTATPWALRFGSHTARNRIWKHYFNDAKPCKPLLLAVLVAL